jgi:hypothetical protein
MTPQTTTRAASSSSTTNVALIEQEGPRRSMGRTRTGFNSRPIYQRFLVILAAPAFSVLLGWLALAWWGWCTACRPTRPASPRFFGRAGGNGRA